MQNTANFHGLSNRSLQIGQNFGNVHVGPDTRDESTKHRDLAEEWRKVLFITDPEVDREQIKSAKGERVPGTCQWISKHPKYIQWDEGHKPFLWICGDPGQGKTMLSIYLTERLELFNKKTNTNVLYFFCDSRQNTRNSDTAILRGLLVQLLRLQPSLQYHVSSRGDPQNKFVTSRDALWLLWRDMLHDPIRQPIKCVIDGVDECNKDCFTWLCEHIAWLLKAMPVHSEPCQVLIVSRKGTPLKSWPTIDLDSTAKEEVQSDIIRFINDRTKDLSNLLDCTEVFEKTVKNELLNRCEGSFLWLGCVIQVLLRKTTCSDAEIALQGFPAGLGPLYDRLLLSIEPEHATTCATVLRWAVHAIKPITLPQLAEILGIKESRTISANQAVHDRVKWCEPLIRLEPSDRNGSEATILPIHLSLIDYLTKPRKDDLPALQSFTFDPEETHLQMALACLEHLKMKGETILSRMDANMPQQRDPFLEYAIYALGYHLSLARSHARKFLLPEFNPNGLPWIQVWWHWYMSIRYPPECVRSHLEALDQKPPPVMHIAASLGIVAFAEEYIADVRSLDQVKMRINGRDVTGVTPLIYAIQEGHSDFVDFLLRNGAVVDGPSIFIAATEGHFLLFGKIYLMHADGETDDPNSVFLPTKHALKTARRTKAEGIKYSGNMNATVALEASLSILRMLLPRINIIDCALQLSETLSWNVIAGREDIVRLLIDYVPSFDHIPITQRFAWESQLLAYAVLSFESPSVLALILDRYNIDVNIRIRLTEAESLPLLIWSVEKDRACIVHLLLERGAKLKDHSGFKARILQCAARNGHVRLLNLIIQRGAHVNEKVENSSALHAASGAGQEETVQELIHVGANINATNGSGETPLILAATQGHAGTVKKILEGGASVNVKSQKSKTALDMARAEGHEQVVAILEKHVKDKGKLSK
jgi:ankyrin repeat protein